MPEKRRVSTWAEAGPVWCPHRVVATHAGPTGRPGRGRSPSTEGSVRLGSFASALAKTGSRAASSGRVSAKAGGGELRWWLMTTAALECGNSCDPVSMW